MNYFENQPSQSIKDVLKNNQYSLPEKNAAIKEYLFPFYESRAKASGKDAKGRPIKYFRLIPLESAANLLGGNSFSAEDNSNFTNTEFSENKSKIQTQTEYYFRENGITEFDQSDFESLKNFRNMLYLKIPRRLLFKFHNYIGSNYRGLAGIFSLSVGTPLGLPLAPKQAAWAPEGITVVEFAIPPEQISVCGSDKDGGWIGSENEKEIYTKNLESIWITDMYLSEKDMADRLLSDPNCPAHEYYSKLLRQGDSSVLHNSLVEYRQNEKLADLIPQSKIQELDPDSDISKKPFGEV